MPANECDNPASSTEMLRLAQPGEIIAFGHYPQTAGGADRTPIMWRVLHNSSSELFLLSDALLDCKRYHRAYVDVTWRGCDLRDWLNETFYYTAFNTDEMRIIKTTHCMDNGEESPDTEDKIFLLSVAEARSLTYKHSEDASGVQRRATGTEFARVRKTDGCRLYVYDKGVDADYLTENGTKHGCSWWWLRTQPDRASRAYFIGTRSSIRSYARVNLACYGIRPALKLDLSHLTNRLPA